VCSHYTGARFSHLLPSLLLLLLLLLLTAGNESVPIRLAQCRLPGLAISNAKMLIYFSLSHLACMQCTFFSFVLFLC